MNSGKTEISGFYKTSEGVIINKDNAALAAYKAKKEKNAKLNNMEKDVDELKSDIKEIKELLKGLVK